MARGGDPDGTEFDAESVRDVLERHPVCLGVLFGSHARGTGGVHSDVDVAVEFDRSLSIDDRRRARLELIVDLTRALGTDDVDVADLDGIRPEVGASALEDGVVVVGSPERAAALRERFEERAPNRTRTERLDRFDELLAEMEDHVDA